MLSFKQFCSILMEDRIEFLRNLHPGQHDEIDHYSRNADPSSKKVYTQWIMNLHNQKKVRPEDHPRIKTALTNFDRYKGKLEKRDINQYKRLSDVEDALEPHIGTVRSKKEEISNIKTKGAELIHDDKEADITVHHIKTKEAACHYGKGTRWCTAGNKDNMFNRYNSSGKIHIIHDHKNGRKYQFHANDEQFMDEKDNHVNLNDIPHIKKSLAKSDNHEIVKANLVFNPDYKIPEHHVEKLAKSKDYQTRAQLAKRPEHAGKLVNDENEYVRGMVATHHEHAGKLVNDPSHYVRETVAKFHPEHAGKLVNDTSHLVRREVAIHTEHAGKLVNDTSPLVREVVARHPEHAGKLVNDPSHYVRGTVATHPEHAGKLVNDPKDWIRDIAASTLKRKRTKK